MFEQLKEGIWLMSAIKNICAAKKLDLRGNSSLEVSVELESGHRGVGFAPLTLDLNTAITDESILDDIKTVNQIIFKALKGKDALDQQGLDKIILNVSEKSGGSTLKNATIAVSIAIAKAASSYCKLPIYRYIGGANKNLFPMPLSTVIRGGFDVNNKINIKEFILVPVGFRNFKDSIYGSSKVFNKIGELLEEHGRSTNIQNGYISDLNGDLEALEIICDAINGCGYNLGDDFFIGLNVSASEWKTKQGRYKLPKEIKLLSSEQIGDYLFELCQKYPIIFIEDPLGRRDYEGYRKLKNRMTDVKIVGNIDIEDILEKLQTGAYSDVANAVVVSLKDIRTLSELMNLVELSRQASCEVIMSDRSLNKENSLIADIIIGLGIKHVKIGTPIVADRVCKFKRFLELEEFFNERMRSASPWKY